MTIFRICLIFSCLLYCAKSVYAQSFISDSVVQIINSETKTEEQKIDALNIYGKSVARINADSALQILNRAKNWSQTLNYQKGIVAALNEEGVIYKDKRLLELSEKTLQEALELNEPLQNTAKKAAIMFNLASTKYLKDHFLESLDILYEVIKIDTQNGDEVGLAYDYFRLGEIHYSLNNLDRAQEFLNKSLPLLKKHQIRERMISALNLYSNIFIKEEKIDSALYYNNLYIAAAKESDYLKHLSTAYHGTGRIHAKTKDYIKAKTYFQKALETAAKTNYTNQIAISTQALGVIENKLGNPAQAFKLFENARSIYKEIDNSEAVMKLHFAEYEAYQNTQDYEKALASYKIYVDSLSSITNAKYNEKILRLENQQKVREQERENEVLALKQESTAALAKRRKTISYFLAALLFISGILAYVLYRGYRREQNFSKVLQKEVSTKTEELQKSYAEIIDINRNLKLFYATIAHDFRYPVLLLQSNLAKLEKAYQQFNTEKVYKDSQRILDNLYNSFEELMKFFRMEDSPLQVENIHLDALLDDVIFQLNNAEVINDLTVNATELGSLRADPLLMRQVFINLINNAAKFTTSSAKPTLTIRTEKKGDNTHLYFKDNGIGVSENMKDKIFEAFTVDNSLNNHNLGMGLFIVKSIVERHQGKVGLKSLPNQPGTEFELIFPQ